MARAGGPGHGEAEARVRGLVQFPHDLHLVLALEEPTGVAPRAIEGVRQAAAAQLEAPRRRSQRLSPRHDRHGHGVVRGEAELTVRVLLDGPGLHERPAAGRGVARTEPGHPVARRGDDDVGAAGHERRRGVPAGDAVGQDQAARGGLSVDVDHAGRDANEADLQVELREHGRHVATGVGGGGDARQALGPARDAATRRDHEARAGLAAREGPAREAEARAGAAVEVGAVADLVAGAGAVAAAHG